MDKPLTWQQKVWIQGRTLFRSIRPLLVYIFLPAASLAVGFVFAHKDMSAEEFFTYGGNFYTALGMVLTLTVFWKWGKGLGMDLAEEKKRCIEAFSWKKAAGFLLFGISAAFAWSAFLTLLPDMKLTNTYTESSTKAYYGRDVLFSVLTSTLTAPVAEEIVFRGCMLNTLLETYSTRAAVLIVTAVFALCHGDLIWIFYAFVMGLMLAGISLKEDNILYCMLMHIGFNMPAAMIWAVQSSEKLSQAVFGSKWLITAYGFIGLLAAALLAEWYLHPKEKGKRR